MTREERNEMATRYRDATYSADTQERLRELLAELTTRPGWNADARVHALTDVIERWDANDATEFEDEDGATEFEDEDIALARVIRRAIKAEPC